MCAAIYIVLAPYIIDLLTAGRYIYSAYYSQIIALSTITAAMYYSSCQVTIAMGYTKLLMVVKIFGSILSMLCFTTLIHFFQFEGAAYGNIASYFISFIINLLALLLFKKKIFNQQ